MLSSTPSSPGSDRAAFLANLEAEQERRRKAKSTVRAKYVNDPVGWVEHRILGTLWSKQRTILESIRDNRFTAVPSCHDVGKSRVAACAAAWWIDSHEPGEAFVVTVAPTAAQVRAILWREIGRLHREGGLPGVCLTTEWKLDNGELIAYGRSPADNDPTAVQGIHAKYVLVILDEACGVAKPIWDALSSLTANDFSRTLAIGNPDDPSTEFEAVCKPGSGWNVIPISAYESPNFTGEAVPEWLRPLLVGKTWVAERLRKWGENSPLYLSKVLGKFPEQASDGLLSLGDIQKAQDRSLAPGTPVDLGVDVARYGTDFSVIYLREGNVARCHKRMAKRDTMTLVGEVVNAVEETGARRVKIDDSGVGGGVTDRLQELQRGGDLSDGGRRAKRLLSGVQIIPINVGEAPTIKPDPDDDKESDTERYLNLRAQLNWAMRERFVGGIIDIAPGDEDLIAQAADIKYMLTSRGQIQIESKDDMRKRGRHSPDDWDALVLAFAEIGLPEMVISDDFLARTRLMKSVSMRRRGRL